ncbi:MAG: glutamate--tRNA ligase [Patescibacteria group bacterium]
MNNIRTRFAPSPTGELHIGGVWMALFGYMYAKHTGGKFILRIEDTDRNRFVVGAEERLIETLHWYGIQYDEGPDIGGPYGPYRQSDRLALYQEHARQLLANGSGYRCFCSAERLAQVRKEQELRHAPTGYDGACRELAVAEANARAEQEPHVVRLRMPREGGTKFIDSIRGEVNFQNALLDDPVLLKSDGWPTYHLASVVDDHLMEINQVIRGEEWLPSTPKHLVTYAAFGWQPPQYAHVPLILGTDRLKLSKRHGAAAAAGFQEQGYVQPALINFLALLGWHPKTDRELYSLTELCGLFELADVNKAGAIFNMEKLQWMNQQYLRAMPENELTERTLPFLIASNVVTEANGNFKTASGNIVSRHMISAALRGTVDRMQTLADAPGLVAEMLSDAREYETELLLWKGSTATSTAVILQSVKEYLGTLPDSMYGNAEELEKKLREWIAEEGRSVGDVLWPLRVALSGQAKSPSPFIYLTVLGREVSLERVERAYTSLTKGK